MKFEYMNGNNPQDEYEEKISIYLNELEKVNEYFLKSNYFNNEQNNLSDKFNVMKNASLAYIYKTLRFLNTLADDSDDFLNHCQEIFEAYIKKIKNEREELYEKIKQEAEKL